LTLKKTAIDVFERAETMDVRLAADRAGECRERPVALPQISDRA
jgi:hypothetical protein